MYLNLHESHFSYISDINKYSHSYRCRTCDSVWKTVYKLHRHEYSCESTVKRVYPGGVYNSPQSIFQQLEEEGICVDDERRYYPYRATFDFECYFDDTNLSASSSHRQWLARLEVLSVSIASNIEGHTEPRCFVSNGNPKEVVGKMMSELECMSNDAYESLQDRFEDVFEQLNALRMAWSEKEAAMDEEEDEKKNPVDQPIQRFHSYLKALPVIGFNSGKYDLNVIKKYITAYLLDDDADEEVDCRSPFYVIKKNNNFMCLSTDTLTFLDITIITQVLLATQLSWIDITNYLAQGFGYEKFLKAYGCAMTKGFLPYEWINSLDKLDYPALPPKDAFSSQLKNEDISEEDYALCERVWKENNMTTFRDFLIWYNNRDVVPFLENIDKQFAFYKERRIDMFKDGISVPGLTLKYLFETLPPKTCFTLFNEKHRLGLFG